MKLNEVVNPYGQDNRILDHIRQVIDARDAFKLEAVEFSKSLARSLGTTRAKLQKDAQKEIDLQFEVLARGFQRSARTKNVLYMGVPNSLDIETPRDQYLLATEDEDLARIYARGGNVVRVEPGAVTLDFDRLIGSPDGQRTHLFNKKQAFKVIEREFKHIHVRPVQSLLTTR